MRPESAGAPVPMTLAAYERSRRLWGRCAIFFFGMVGLKALLLWDVKLDPYTSTAGMLSATASLLLLMLGILSTVVRPTEALLTADESFWLRVARVASPGVRDFLAEVESQGRPLDKGEFLMLRDHYARDVANHVSAGGAATAEIAA